MLPTVTARAFDHCLWTRRLLNDFNVGMLGREVSPQQLVCHRVRRLFSFASICVRLEKVNSESVIVFISICCLDRQFAEHVLATRELAARSVLDMPCSIAHTTT